MTKLRFANHKRTIFGAIAFIGACLISILLIWHIEDTEENFLNNGEIMARLIIISGIIATLVFCFTASAKSLPDDKILDKHSNVSANITKSFAAQVVGLQWLNPLQRMDYSTEWHLLRILDLVGPNKDDDMVKAKPHKYGSIQPIGSIAVGNDGEETFDGYHRKYLRELLVLYRDIYFSDSRYFYNAHSRKDRSTWRELAGIHVEYALPAGKIDPIKAGKDLQEDIIDYFDIGNQYFPNAWSKSTPPDISVTSGGANAGFTSLAKGLDYLQAHPSETVWIMNWDAPSRPLDRQIDENIVQLILAGPDYKTGRAPLAWLSYPASAKTADFTTESKSSPRSVQAWKFVFAKAALNAGKQTKDIGFVIHDANATHPESTERLAPLAQTITEQLPELDFTKQTFNTPALLGEMRAGSALTNVALAIAYANHIGKNVLVAGTTELNQPTATVVIPPAVVRPINPDEPWFRARGGNTTYLPWWGIRHDATKGSQGYSR
jgi:hypothetical protein